MVPLVLRFLAFLSASIILIVNAHALMTLLGSSWRRTEARAQRRVSRCRMTVLVAPIAGASVTLSQPEPHRDWAATWTLALAGAAAWTLLPLLSLLWTRAVARKLSRESARH